MHPINTLFKIRSTDEYGKQVIEYVNSLGQQILKKVQLDDVPAGFYPGWICTYNVYDDFGLLRYSLQPEAVKYLSNNSWSFAGANGTQMLNELCFRYEYDEKGRTVLKKAPGAAPLRMLYDARDRVVFMQDGNQAAKVPAEWTTNIYDELDRPVASVLYQTSKTVANLKADLATAPAVAAIAISAQSVTIATYLCALTSAELNNTSVTTILKYNFYDDYSYTGVKTFTSSFDNTLAYPSGGDPIVQTVRTTSMVTGTKTRVLGTTTFLSSSVYYDDNGRPIQNLEDNIKTGVDVTTMQYQWDGRLLSTNTKHTATATGYTAYSIVTKNVYDKIGRVTGIEKKFGSNAFKQIGIYNFDDMGRLKNKRLAPGYTGTGKTEIETLNYSYNLHNNITGINKTYALKAAGYNKTDNFFGMYLGYDNRDAVFVNNKLDGHVTGILWKTRGDDAQRRYDFAYDNAGQLAAANFTEKEKLTDAWGTLKMNLSVGGSGTGATIGYDLNGNIQSMYHKTVLPGNASAQNMDNLSYTYASLSNRLNKVTDAGTLGSNNGKLGDFVDGVNGGDDYVYDANGNLIIDLNKNATNVTGGVATTLGTSGIKYNFLDKPEEIRITGKGVIKIVYDADGNKLQRSYTPDAGTAKVTSYINEYVYEDNTLQYINFEEGRLRVMQATSQDNGFDMLTIDGNMDLPGGKRGAYDYFIRDYQGNVRVILTEETHTGRNNCTMETNRAPNEEPVFGQAGSGNEVSATRVGTPLGWDSNDENGSVSKLSSAGKKVGPNVLLKVMSGDNISGTAGYYYASPVTNSSGANNLIGSVLPALINAITGSGATSGIVKDGSGNINTTLNGNIPFGTATAPDASNAIGDKPKAYLTVLFFDERFNFVEEGSKSDRVKAAGDGAAALTLTNTKAPKNGYAFVYLSNESNTYVYFDNFEVTHVRGRLVEENSYYPHGLKIAALSSKVFDATSNPYQYQGDYNDFEDETCWNDFELRSYDGQIGRFLQNDPYNQFPSPYTGMGNDPVNNIDEDGGWSWGLNILTGAATGAVVGALTAKSQGENVLKGAVVGAVIGGGIGSVVSSLTMESASLSSNAFKILSKAFNQGMVNSLTTLMQNGSINDIFRNSIVGLGSGAISGYLSTTDVEFKRDISYKDNGTSINLNSDGIGNIVGKTINGIFVKGLQALNDKRSGKEVFFHALYGGLDGFVGASIAEMIFKETILPRSILSKDLTGSIVGSIRGIGASAIQVSSVYLMGAAAIFGYGLNAYQRASLGIGGAGLRFVNLNKHFKNIEYKNYMIKDLYNFLLAIKQN